MRPPRPIVFPTLGWTLVMVILAPTTGATQDSPNPGQARAERNTASLDVTEPPPLDDFLILPLRLHVFTSQDLPDVTCALTHGDLARIMGKVNTIWHVAGVHWGVDSVTREPAARQDRFRRVLATEPPGSLNPYRLLVPPGRSVFDGIHVYYLRRFPVNGVWMGNDFAIVQETARLREVEGGIDEPIPRVTAHELGHALGLPHRQDRTNLLASGTTGTLLNAHEVEVARARARRTRGSMTVKELIERAEQAARNGNHARALELWSWLADVPGGRERAAEGLERLRTRNTAPGR